MVTSWLTNDSCLLHFNTSFRKDIISSMPRSSSKVLTRSKNKVRKKWQLFRAADFQSLMYPCFIFCFILGIFPYKISSSTFTASKTRYISSTIIICLFFGYALVVLYQIDISGTLKYDNVPATLQVNCFLILGTAIAVITYILSGPRMRLLQTILEISTRLPSESYRKMSRLIHIKDIFGFLFLLGQVPNLYSKTIYHTLAKVIGMYITLLVFQMDMLYMNCVCVLKSCFKRINDNLSTLKKLVKNNESDFYEIFHHEQRNPFLIIELKALKKRHLIISDVVQLLNINFSLQLLATIVLTFGEITFGLYFYMLQEGGTKVVDLEKQIWHSYFVMSIAYYSVKMTLIVWACETAKNQAMEIGTSVHDVIISTTDKEIRDELQLFSLQVLHRENILSAKGINVDATLLTKIVGNITTYLLILIQFLFTMLSCKHDGLQAATME